ncbi:MAG TPA: F0F1 ATP synthase subunit A [Candidatus Marinimicrobia bacterium]|jgi:F-type H+-transporting ATPase subunit a|nr:F0F1 ATP synthase subunit A [Candidatus Neomarinimicrobiota bacterium]|tara:strand:- start:585 stop:1583 length:999 start_codon:yes stop_codon:yes gene_type:complete
MKIRLIFLFYLLFAIVLADNSSHYNSEYTHSELKVDGEYIMHHIQDDKVFELFNPLDWNDGNHDHYYYTTKVKLDQSWNKINNIPIISNYLNWMWDPSTDPFTLFPSNNQLIFSKQSIMMLLASAIIILLFIIGYKKDRKVQSGIGNLLEVFVVFIRDEVVYPNMGEKQGRRFLPLILTFFFFIVMLNLLGLIPGSATATASFSVTVSLALVTFFTYIIFGNRDFWKHIFATPGVPFWLLPIMIPVELIGLITKPFALSVRLLANMNAGHIIILAFLGIIINMQSVWVAIGSVPMALAINMLEIFVAFLQGYIFSLLSSIFIGMAVIEHEHH